MAVGVLEVQYSFPYFTNIPKDVITNTWHFQWLGGVDPVSGDYGTLRGIINTFYGTLFSSATNNALAPWVNKAQVKWKVYDLDQPIPRVPVNTATINLTASSAASSSIPPELSLCISYKGLPVPGIPLASTRGRLYIGGIGAAVTAGGAAAFPTPAATVITAFTAAPPAMLTALSSTSWRWVVYSRKLGITTPVTDGWVDNAFDTQRRRGQAASARTLWP